jgi:O-antigen chain-terminating methyltransferase
MRGPVASGWRQLRAAAGLLRRGPARLTGLEQRAAQLEAQLDRRVGQLEAFTTDLHAHLAAAVAALGTKASQDDLVRQTQQLRDRLAAIEGRPVAAADDRPTAEPGSSAGEAGASSLEQAFYLALEQHFRGTEQQIADRLVLYRPWLDDLPAGQVADLGCGRGEWLRLLHGWGLDALGVDSNTLNVANLEAQGHRAVCADALAWLRRQPAQSLAAITAFHLAEHLPFAALLELVDQARRVLLPGGRLIIETPNPESLDVGLHTFWLDPTHRRPLPPSLLEFVVSYCGLRVEEVPRLNPLPAGSLSGNEALDRLLAVGRDYAVIARRPLAAEPGAELE